MEAKRFNGGKRREETCKHQQSNLMILLLGEEAYAQQWEVYRLDYVDDINFTRRILIFLHNFKVFRSNFCMVHCILFAVKSVVFVKCNKVFSS